MSKLTIKFYPYEQTVNGGEVPVYCRLTKDRKKAEFHTGAWIKLEDWNPETEGHRKKVHSLNEELTNLKAEIFNIRKRLEYEGKPVSAKLVKDIYKSRDTINTFLISYYDQFLQQMERGGEHSKETVSIYRQTKDKIAQFLDHIKETRDYPALASCVESFNSQNEILLQRVDYKFINSLDNFLISRPLDRNTVYKHHSRFRTVLIRAFKEGLISKQPYIDFKLRKVKKEPVYLELEEIEKLLNHNLGGYPGLVKARDIFIFSVFTGLRYRAAQNLTIEQIKFDKTDKPYLEFDPGKEQLGEQRISKIPLLEPAYRIVQKYDNEEREITGKILPRIANGTINKHLKVIADLTGIEKHLTHHVARHTCATTVLFGHDVDIKTVSNWLSHSSVKMTEHYTHNNISKLMKVAETLEKGFSNNNDKS